jgi:2-hydroxymuconate-semialdehyde hydrolase
MSAGRFVAVDGARTHYLEAGEAHRGVRPTVLLLHSAEFGGAAELSWEFVVGELGKRRHVLAPDHLGFGRTDKIFDFVGQFDRRIQHIRRFMETMGVGPAHVVGSSMSGGLSLTVAARRPPDWRMASLTVCSGGGEAPDNEARKVLNTYDGSPEHMRRILSTMFVDPKWSNDAAYLARRQEIAHLPGAWEATAAARFKAPFPTAGANRRERDSIDYAAISVPTLVFAGALDPLRAPKYWESFVPKIPRAQLHVFERAAHMGNIECPAEFNARLHAFFDEAERG